MASSAEDTIMSTVVEADAPTTPEEAVEASWARWEGAGRSRAWNLSRKSEIDWLRQISKHLTHIESRLMTGNLMGHEVVRHIGILIEAFSPPPGVIGGG